MHEITDRALDTARVRGASYADVRVVRRRAESIDVKSGRLAGVLSHETEGFGVRVLVDGARGFASSHRLTAGEADRVAAAAVRIARASATAIRRPVVLVAADEAMRRVEGIAFADTTYGAQREEKTFAARYLDALAAVEAVASGRRLLRGELWAVLVPALRIGSWRYTGVTAGG